MSRWIPATAVVVCLGFSIPLKGIAEHHEGGEGGPQVSMDKRLYDSAVRVGADYFQQYCAVCHGTDARGGGEYAALLAVEPPDLTRIAARRGGKFPDDEVVKTIRGLGSVRAHGPKVMPMWDTVFGPEKTSAEGGTSVGAGKAVLLAEYLKTLQRK